MATDSKIASGKLQLLEAGRKAEYDDTQVKLRRQKDLAKSMRKENKELRGALTSTVRGKVDFQSKEQDTLRDQAFALRRKLDALRGSITTKKTEYSSIQERNGDLQTESQPLMQDDDPLNRKIRMLENRLDKSMIKYNEAMNIRRTYEAIVKRLQQERVTFDNQLASIEKTLQAKEHDYQELLNMCHEANHAKEIAKTELMQFKTSFEEDRKQKKVELDERRVIVQQRIEQRMKLEKKGQQKISMEEAARSKAEEEDRKRREQQQVTAELKSEEERERLTAYAEAFKRIKEATGADTVEDVIHKFMAQEDTHQTLIDMTKEAQAKMDRLNAERTELRSKMEEAKFSGSGQLGSRRILDEFETHLTEAKIQAKKWGQNYETLAKIFIDVKAGVEHLLDKLASFKPEVHCATTADENLVEVMRHVGHKLQLLMDETVGAAEVTNDELSASGAMELPPNNLRVRLAEKEEEDDVQVDDEDEGDEDVYDRERVKKFAQIAVQRETKKKKKKNKANEDA
jgi:chromosome segregation ATPase